MPRTPIHRPKLGPGTLLAAALLLAACTGTGETPSSGTKGSLGQAAPPKRAFNTIAHRMLDSESEVSPVPAEKYALLDRILRQAKERVHFNPAEPDPGTKRAAALAALDAMDQVIMENNIVFPPSDWVTALGDGLENHTLTEQDLQGVLKNTFSPRRAAYLKAHRGEVFHYMDCDVLSFLYIAIGQVVGMDLRFVEVPHHAFVRYYLNDDDWINWETTVPEEQSDGDYRADHRGITDRAVEEGIFLCARSDEELWGYFLCCRGMLWESLKTPNYQRAAEDYARSIDLHPRLQLSRNNLAWLYVSVPGFWKGPKTDAVQLALSAVSMDLTDGENLDTLATCYAEAGDFAKAIAYENEAINCFEVTNPAAKDDKKEFQNRLDAFKKGKTYIQTLQESAATQPKPGPATRR